MSGLGVIETQTMAMYGFVIVMADEGIAQLESCLGFLRAAYPVAPVVVISDGCDDATYAPCCQRHGVKFVQSTYLKRIECGGLWWKRTLEAGLKLRVKYIVKIDPDTRVWRPFSVEPQTPVAGTISRAGTEHEHVQGGCQAITTDAAKQILYSSILTSDQLRNHRWISDLDFRQLKSSAYLSTDSSLAWILRNLGIAWGDWSECHCVWVGDPMTNTDQRYAVTHPHRYWAESRSTDAALYVITTCKGRLSHLKQTLPTWLAEPNVKVTVVDYDCPEGTADWVRQNHPDVNVVHVQGTTRFNLAAARNFGAANTDAGWWCFWDADCLASPGWSRQVRDSLRHQHYLLANPIEWDQFGSVVVHSYDYHQAGGYDELFKAWGPEDSDFYARLRHRGIRPGSFPGDAVHSIRHENNIRTAFYDASQITESQKFYDIYVEHKATHMRETGQLPDRDACLAAMQATATQFDGELASKLLPTEPATIPVVTIYPPTPREPMVADSPAPELTTCRDRCARQKTTRRGWCSLGASIFTISALSLLASVPKRPIAILAAIGLTVIAVAIRAFVRKWIRDCPPTCCRCCGCTNECERAVSG